MFKTLTMDELRIIPADAGSTYAGKPVEVAHEDHPRGCGEHQWSGVP